MRVILIIAFLLQVSFSTGQEISENTYTLQEALKTAFSMNPSYDRKKLAYEVKSAWHFWLFRIHKWHTLEEYQYMLGDLNRIATLRYQSGDVGFYETSALLEELADIQTSAAISANEIEISHNTICGLLMSNDRIIPADSVLSLYEIDKGTGMISPVEITGTKETDDSLTSRQAFIHAKSVENKQLELDNLFIKLQFYNAYGLAHAETTIHTAQARFNAEEIDYFEFVEKLAEAYRIRLEYLEILNNYNQNAIQLEYYAY